jgi:16S rRNA (guanine527-N7)-methyltransferase
MPAGSLKERIAKAAQRDVSRETMERLETYAGMLEAESRRQNLISRATTSELWERHIVDSAQLARFEPRPGASWCDIGSGAGLPGIVLACLATGPITLIEPRRLRAEFLARVVQLIGINATTFAGKVERATGQFDVITARAVAPLPRLLEMSQHLSTRKTVWALPKGRNALGELAEAQRAWQGAFHVEQSVTDDASFIIVGTDVRAKRR